MKKFLVLVPTKGRDKFIQKHINAYKETSNEEVRKYRSKRQIEGLFKTPRKYDPPEK